MFDDETLRTLANVAVFQGLTPDEVERFHDAAQRVTFNKTETVIEKGQVGSALYIILKGQFEVGLPLGVYVSQQAEGQVERRTTQVQLNTLKAGDCFGEYSLIDQQPASASVIATQPGELLQVTKAA